MNDLPVGTPPSDPVAQQQPPQQPMTVHSGGVEGEGFATLSELPLKPAIAEVDLPKEVQAAGVSQTPTTVQLPQLVQDHGVQSVGHNVPTTPTTGSSVTLPLTDEQIETALKVNVKQSIRWLAEWCVFQFKKAHRVVSGKHH
jgi:hypothetical protein